MSENNPEKKSNKVSNVPETNFRPNSQNALDDVYHGDDLNEDSIETKESFDPTANWDG